MSHHFLIWSPSTAAGSPAPFQTLYKLPGAFTGIRKSGESDWRRSSRSAVCLERILQCGSPERDHDVIFFPTAYKATQHKA
ncbi:hypothetical protein COCON_G00110530 [Conger conger]|uniref:Uncharacterized protein n=1 Tax=Conger conger TaxID=82655 RepID=A0A9Q1DJI0_CONCO|nr:hypothetical protein COCON_G00110530 [Conger conger]